MVSYFEAILLGLLQGFTELFPISSLGHSVIFAWLFEIDNGSGVNSEFFLMFVIAMHVATALALIIFYRDIWLRIITGFFGSLRRQRIHNADARLGWLLLLATIPTAGLALIFESALEERFAEPLSAIIFLFINGIIMIAGDQYQRSQHVRHESHSHGRTTERVSNLNWWRAGMVGISQSGALLAGISRSGITMVGGLLSGLNNQDAARFSFLLGTPIILGAGIVKLPDFFSEADPSVRGPILAGSLVGGMAAYIAVKYLDRYFQNKSLRPFGVYCLVFAASMFVVGLVRGF